MSTFKLNFDTKQFRFTGLIDPALFETQFINIVLTEREKDTKFTVTGLSGLIRFLTLINTQAHRVMPANVDIWGAIQE